MAAPEQQRAGGWSQWTNNKTPDRKMMRCGTCKGGSGDRLAQIGLRRNRPPVEGWFGATGQEAETHHRTKPTAVRG